MWTESMLAEVSYPPPGLCCSRMTTPLHSSRTGAAVSAGVTMTKLIGDPTPNDTSEANTTLSAPTLLVTPRTSPISIGIAKLWHGHASLIIVFGTEPPHDLTPRARAAIHRKV